MRTIKINCEGCLKTHEVSRDKEAPSNATSMTCNWCPDCESSADNYYEEWYNLDDGDNSNYESNDPNQLMLLSITDEIINSEKGNVSEILNEETRPKVIQP